MSNGPMTRRQLWSARTCPRFPQATCRRRTEAERPTFFLGPLNAALLWRQVAQAAKAVTSHRTPNLCGCGASRAGSFPERLARPKVAKDHLGFRVVGAGMVSRISASDGTGLVRICQITRDGFSAR